MTSRKKQPAANDRATSTRENFPEIQGARDAIVAEIVADPQTRRLFEFARKNLFRDESAERNLRRVLSVDDHAAMLDMYAAMVAKQAAVNLDASAPDAVAEFAQIFETAQLCTAYAAIVGGSVASGRKVLMPAYPATEPIIKSAFNDLRSDPVIAEVVNRMRELFARRAAAIIKRYMPIPEGRRPARSPKQRLALHKEARELYLKLKYELSVRGEPSRREDVIRAMTSIPLGGEVLTFHSIDSILSPRRRSSRRKN